MNFNFYLILCPVSCCMCSWLLLLLLLSMVLWTLSDKHCVSTICHPVCHLLAGCVGEMVERSRVDLVTSSVECADGRGGTVFLGSFRFRGLFWLEMKSAILKVCLLIRPLERARNLSRVDLRKSCPFPACCCMLFSLFCDTLPPLSLSFFFPSFCIPALFNLCWHFQSSDVQTQTAQTAEFLLQS